ncbi:MAG: endonuclease [Clostridium sp.]|nr:endonuclease [Clostridium sp.]
MRFCFFKGWALGAFLGAGLYAAAEAPAGYYSSCEGKGGQALIEALNSVVFEHTNVGYSGLWTMYRTTDTRADGTIWDMYSTKHWTYSREQCGSYGAVGDCYNREHSMPKSWFDDASPMYSDGFHIYPTDGKVNGQRSNYPYGECANGTTLSAPNGIKALGKLGKCTFPGYSGTVFEPDDEYKGDFARSYFYMAACYNHLIDDWHSDMLAGNSYPAFKSWAVELLLKWHRQDPVSSKEIARNEAVYGFQHNRNPFIDHPEMAEYIWGDKKAERWSANGEPTLAVVGGNEADMGTVAVGVKAEKEIRVKGVNLKEDVKISTSGGVFAASPSTISAKAACGDDGAVFKLSITAAAEGEYASEIYIASGELKQSITAKARAVAGIPANEPRYVTDCSAMASWTYVGDGTTYTLTLSEAGLAEPVRYTVDAAKGEYLIEDLEAETEYSYRLASAHLQSNDVKFTTGEAIPFIELMSSPYFEGEPGMPGEAQEIGLSIENVKDPIRLSVDAPFEISADKADWGHSITIDPEQETIYGRINGEKAGKYGKLLLAEAGDYVNDEMYIYGEVAERREFLEDFEEDAEGCDTYNGCDYAGAYATWHFSNAGIWPDDRDVLDRQGVRMGKNSNSCIEMTSDKEHGLGTVTVWAKQWNSSEGQCTFALEYSLDGGKEWAQAGMATVNSNDYKEYSFAVNKAGNGRVRVRQTAGKRFMVDNIGIGDYTASIVEAGSAGWDAYCRGHRLAIEAGAPVRIRVYGVDGVMRYDDLAPAGLTMVELEPGLYIVSDGQTAKRVLVK